VQVVGDVKKIRNSYDWHTSRPDAKRRSLFHHPPKYGGGKAAIPIRPGNINTLQGTHQNALGPVRQLWKFIVCHRAPVVVALVVPGLPPGFAILPSP
jgi:hypothetical protein